MSNQGTKVSFTYGRNPEIKGETHYVGGVKPKFHDNSDQYLTCQEREKVEPDKKKRGIFVYSKSKSSNAI